MMNGRPRIDGNLAAYLTRAEAVIMITKPEQPRLLPLVRPVMDGREDHE